MQENYFKKFGIEGQEMLPFSTGFVWDHGFTGHAFSMMFYVTYLLLTSKIIFRWSRLLGKYWWMPHFRNGSTELNYRYANATWHGIMLDALNWRFA